MKALRYQPLTKAIQLSLLIGLPGLAAAQDAPAPAAPANKATTLDTITVTGTRIRRTDLETASPVFQIDRQAIDKSGALTIGDFIQDVPSMAGAATNPSVNNGGGAGAATVSLRGLGEVRTLLLLDGRRIVTNDVNSIPMSMVERVEILKDGASALYGSDAVGGVVNFILRKSMDGLSTTASYGISDHTDGERVGLSATFGHQGERGGFIVSANYNNQQEITAADRAFSKDAKTLGSAATTSSPGTPGVVSNGSSRSLNGRYRVPSAVSGLPCSAVARNPGSTGASRSDYHCFGAADLFNYQAVGNLELTPQERMGLFVTGNYDVTDNVQAYLVAFSNRTRSASQIAPLPFDGRPANDNIEISNYNIYNVFGNPNAPVNPATGKCFTTDPTCVNITDSRLRLGALGNRRFEFSTKVEQFHTGLKGAFGETSWHWDFGVSNGQINQESAFKGYVNYANFAPALGPSMMIGGVPTCVRVPGDATTAIAGCNPVNFFGSQDPSTAEGQAFAKAMAPYIVNPVNKLKQRTTGIAANVDGDLFEMGAGMVQGAFGFEFRKDSLTFTPDPLAVINETNYTCGIASEVCAAATHGDLSAKEFYGELFIPLLADAPWAKSLNLSVGTRFSDYSLFGNTTNSKLGLEWRPNEQLLVRGTYAEVFRVPTITDLYSGKFASSDGFSDPCNGYTKAPTDPTNPACANVPTNGTFKQTDTQLSAIKGGNSDLVPEEGDTVTIGFVYEPNWLPGFSTAVDLWKVHLDETIGTIGTQNILNTCFDPNFSTAANPSPLCSLFSRDANGEIIRLFDLNANVGTTDTKGVDIGFRYNTDTAWGRIRANLDTTYVAQYDQDIIFQGDKVGDRHNAGGFLSPANGGLGNYSRWRGLASLTWSLGNWDAQWTTRYVGGFHVGGFRTNDTCANLFYKPGDEQCRFEVGAHTYHNVQVGWSYAPWNTKIRVGIDNAFDKQPSLLYQNNTLNGNIDERTFDPIGRYFWTSVTVDFK
ncbi:TonB-dependent receptor plug domain-containing protein [Lysobacter tyrosinilyticus]